MCAQHSEHAPHDLPETDIEKVRSRARDVCSRTRRDLKRLEKKQAKQQQEYEEAQKGPWYRQIADSLLAEAPDAHKKSAQRAVYNVHTGQCEEVKLNPKCDAAKNAQLYYKRAQKADRGTHIAGIKLKETGQLISQLQQAHEHCMQCLDESNDTETIQRACDRLESLLLPGGSNRSREKSPHHAPAIPYRHYTIDGWDVYIGKNNTQNDELTTRFAKPWHIWLHVVSHAGSHVVISRDKKATYPPAPVLEKAGALAVWFSKAKHTSFAEVHVTEARFVRKPRKSPPGQVVAERCKTIRVSPQSPESLFPSRKY